MKQTIKQGGIDETRLLWTEIPSHIKKNPAVAAIYFAAMIDKGLVSEIEAELMEVLSISWDETLLLLFGNLNGGNIIRQLEIAESWLAYHQQDALLLTILGKLSFKNKDYGKAEDYLNRSIGADPSVQAYRLLRRFADDQR